MTISFENIQVAHDRIRPFIHRTQVLTCQSINKIVGAEIYFKCENFQKIGAFKIRGGMNAALSLDQYQLSKGLATHSSGNHAQAIAYAAKILGVRAYIVMPSNSPQVKVNAVKSYGAEVIFCEPNQQAREQTLQEVILKTGAEFVHPYNDYRVIAGQATCAKELIEDYGPLDYLITPVGGGGLLSGTALTTKAMQVGARVIGAEPEGAADAVLSFKTGKIEKAPYINTIADGLLTTLGDKTLPIIREHVTDIITVSDTEILAALKLIYERMKIVVEPSCAVPLAVVMKEQLRFEDKKIGIILSGGNVDLKRFCDWF